MYTDGNDGALAAGAALAATMQSFICTHETSHIGTNMAHRVLNRSTQENEHLYQTKTRQAAGRDRISRLDVGLPPTKLLLRLTEQLATRTTHRFRRGHVSQYVVQV